jgi:hypothetical protein
MVFFAVAHFGKLPPIFNQRVTGLYYRNNIFVPSFASLNELFAGEAWISAHTALISLNFERQNAPSFITKNEWPSNLPDISLMDDGIFFNC